jgi:hypothetical protein
LVFLGGRGQIEIWVDHFPAQNYFDNKSKAVTQTRVLCKLETWTHRETASENNIELYTGWYVVGQRDARILTFFSHPKPRNVYILHTSLCWAFFRSTILESGNRCSVLSWSNNRAEEEGEPWLGSTTLPVKHLEQTPLII